MENPSLIDKSRNVSDVDFSIVKLVSFVAVTTVSALAAGYLIASLDSLEGLIWEFVSIVVFLTLFTLQAFFIKSFIRAAVAVLIESAAIFIPILIILRDYWTIYFLWAFLLMFGLLISAYISGRGELKTSLDIHFWRTARHVLSRAVPAVLAFVILIYAFIEGKDLSQGRSDILSQYIIVPIVRVYIPDYSETTTFRGLLEKILERQLGEERYASLSQAERNASLNSTEEFLRDYAGNIKTNVPVGQAIYEAVMLKFQTSDFLAKLYVSFILLAVIWALVKLVTLALFLPISAIAFLIYEVLIATGFVVIQYESRSKEIVILK